MTTDELQTERDGEQAVAEPAATESETLDKTAMARTTVIPADARVQVDDRITDVPESSPMPGWAIGVIAAAALAIVAAVVVAFLVPPTLALDHVLMDFDPSVLVDEELTSSVYASNEGYRVVGQQASGIEDDGTGRKVAHIEVALENESFSVVVGVDRSYTLVDRKWVPGDYRITRVDATPRNPVLPELAVADIEKIMGLVAPYRGTYLAQVYEGGEFEVTGNELGKGDDGSAICTTTIAMNRTHGLSVHQGEVVATFQFFPGAASRDAGSWRLVSAEAAPEAWQQTLAMVTGDWRGALESSANTALLFDTGRCLAGRDTGVFLTVSDYDVDTGTMTVTMSFVVHNHPGIPKDAEGTEGDVVVTLEDQLVVLDPMTLSGSWVPVTSGGEQGAFKVDFLNVDGVWKVQITSGEAGSDGLFALTMVEFVDTYVLTRN